MPKLNAGRTVQSEAALAKRITYERKRRGQSHEALADLMTKAGCAMAGSSVYKIESGKPPRRISVDELVTLAKVWGFTLDQLLEPVELIEQRRGQEIAAELAQTVEAFDGSIRRMLELFLEVSEISVESPEMAEFIHHQFVKRDSPGFAQMYGDFQHLDPEGYSAIADCANQTFEAILRLADHTVTAGTS